MFNRMLLLIVTVTIIAFSVPASAFADGPAEQFGAHAPTLGEDVTGPVSWGFGQGGAKDANGNSVYLDDNNVWQRTEKPWHVEHPVPPGTDYLTTPSSILTVPDDASDVEHFGYFFGDIFRGTFPRTQTGRDVQTNQRDIHRGRELSRRFENENVSNPMEAAQNMSDQLGEKVVPADRD